VVGFAGLRALELVTVISIDALAERGGPQGRGIAGYFGARVAEAAVPVARAAVIAQGEPVEVEILAAGSCGTLADRAVNRIAHRNRAVRAGIVVVACHRRRTGLNRADPDPVIGGGRIHQAKEAEAAVSRLFALGACAHGGSSKV